MEYPRKTVHLLTLLIPVTSYFSVFWTQITLLGFIILYLLLEWIKLKGKNDHLFTFFIALMQRDHEKNTFAKAPLFLALGVLTALTFFSWEAATIGIVMVGLSDTVAAWAGRKWGVTKMPFSTRKTIAGSACFFLSALPITASFLTPIQTISLAFIGAFLESLPFKDWDNLTIPIVITWLAEKCLV